MTGVQTCALPIFYYSNFTITTLKTYTKADGTPTWNIFAIPGGTLNDTIENMTGYEWRISNTGANPINIYNFSFFLEKFFAPLSQTKLTRIAINPGSVGNSSIIRFGDEKNLSDVFGKVKGRMFGAWVDLLRDNGYNENDLIECPPYVIESFIRDEINTVRDLQIDTVTQDADTTYVTINALQNPYDVTTLYYLSNFHNVTTNTVYEISNFVSKVIEIVGIDLGMTAGDNCFLSNLTPNAIDVSTFDAVGNTTNGTRKDWVFARSFFKQEKSEEVLDQMCFESHCKLFKSSDKWKLVALDTEIGRASCRERV